MKMLDLIDTFIVNDGNGSYEVTVDKRYIYCSCIDFINDLDCPHIAFVRAEKGIKKKAGIPLRGELKKFVKMEEEHLQMTKEFLEYAGVL